MLKVVPSKRVSLIKLFSQNDTNLEIKNKDRVEWPAGSSLEKLVYSLFDESGLPVPLTDKVTSEIKVRPTEKTVLQRADVLDHQATSELNVLSFKRLTGPRT